MTIPIAINLCVSSGGHGDGGDVALNKSWNFSSYNSYKLLFSLVFLFITIGVFGQTNFVVIFFLNYWYD